MARDKVVLWLQDGGTYTDQFDAEHDCTVVRQQVVAELVETDSRKGGYGQTVKIRRYRDPLGRKFKYAIPGVSPGDSYIRAVGGEYEGSWKRARESD